MAELSVQSAQCPVIPDKKCEICEVNTVTFKCPNCQQMICANCKKMHLKSKVSEDHKVVCLESAEIYQSSETEKKCPTHTNEDLQMYCGSCKVPICRDCIVSGSHYNHQMDKIENAIDNKLTQLSKLVIESKEKSSQYENIIKTIDKNQHDFSLSISKKINEVKARNTEFKNKIDEITSNYMILLQNLDTENKKLMTEVKERVHEERSDLNNLIQQCESKDGNKNIGMIQFVTNVTQELDKYQPCDPPNSVSPPSLITKHIDDEKLKDIFGYLDTNNISTINQSVSLQRNIKPRNSFREVEIICSFECSKTHVVTTVNDQAWLWRCGSRDLTLVTLDGKVIKDIKSDFDVYDAAVSSSGDLLVTVFMCNKVKKLTRKNTFTSIYKAAENYKTQGITMTDTGNALVVLYQPDGSKIVEITTNGKHIRTVQRDTVDSKLLFNRPNSVCTNINGDIIVSDNYYKVVAVNTSGTKRFMYDGEDRELKKTFNPWYIVTDKYGQIIISDFNNSVLHMLDQDGNFIQYLFTLDDGCRHPTGMAIDNLERLWVCNSGSEQILIANYM